jgi:hypothetical protein
MRWAHFNISVARYGYLSHVRQRPPRRLQLRDAIRLRAGLCQSISEMMVSILSALDVPARTVSMYWSTEHGEDRNHVGAEAYWLSAWHFFDPTWEVYFAAPDDPFEVRSWEELMEGRPSVRRSNEADPGLMRYLACPEDPFAYLRAPRVEFGAIGHLATAQSRTQSRLRRCLGLSPATHQVSS